MNVITKTKFRIEALFLNSQRAQYTNFSLHENSSALKNNLVSIIDCFYADI